MNSEYIYKDGKALIIDDSDKDTSINYYDNLDEVLVKENLIEDMESNIEYLENELKEFDLKKELKIIKKSSWGLFLTSVVAPFVILSFITFFGEVMQGFALVEAFKNSFIIGGIIQPIFVIPMGFIGMVLAQLEYKSNKNGINRKLGRLSQLDFLKKNLEKEKENIKILKKDLTSTKKTNDFERVKVDDIEAFKQLNNSLKKYYDLGYNIEKYYKYFNKGKLDSKLDNYTKEELEEIKQYLKEKGPVLVKRKKN